MSYQKVINDVKFPLLFSAKQKFPSSHLSDVKAKLSKEFNSSVVKETIKAGDKVAIAVGSRGIADLTIVVKGIIEELLKLGAKPIIIPAMGSHGGGTAEGQKDILDYYGVSESTMGVPVISSMEVIDLGRFQNDIPVLFSKDALETDVIIPINRVKVHTAFHGNVESGVLKMLAIGLAKHKGCSMLHSLGMESFSYLIPEIGKYIIQKVTPTIFGVAILENAYKQIADLKIVPGQELDNVEPVLLNISRNIMAKILVDEIDLLIVDEIGKEISGEGMDPNVIRRSISYKSSGEKGPQRIVVLNLTDKTAGNAIGIGMADVTTRRVAKQFDPVATYTNTIATRILPLARMPMAMENDRDAIAAGLLGCVGVNTEKARIVRIKNTNELEKIWISKPILADIENCSDIEIESGLFEIPFNFNGNLNAL